jgi:hypothetical protein
MQFKNQKAVFGKHVNTWSRVDTTATISQKCTVDCKRYFLAGSFNLL